MTGSTHYVAPTRIDRAFNSVVRWLSDRGVSLAGSRSLTVVGRVSGEPRTVPVNPLSFDGSDYLVAVRGETDWVRNARVAGAGSLRRGRSRKTVTMVEVPAAQRAPIIAAYLAKWGWEVGRFLPDEVTVDASADDLAGVAHKIPVFAVS